MSGWSRRGGDEGGARGGGTIDEDGGSGLGEAMDVDKVDGEKGKKKIGRN